MPIARIGAMAEGSFGIGWKLIIERVRAARHRGGERKPYKGCRTSRGNFVNLSPPKDSPPQLPAGSGLLEAFFLSGPRNSGPVVVVYLATRCLTSMTDFVLRVKTHVYTRGISPYQQPRTR